MTIKAVSTSVRQIISTKLHYISNSKIDTLRLIVNHTRILIVRGDRGAGDTFLTFNSRFVNFIHEEPYPSSSFANYQSATLINKQIYKLEVSISEFAADALN